MTAQRVTCVLCGVEGPDVMMSAHDLLGWICCLSRQCAARKHIAERPDDLHTAYQAERIRLGIDPIPLGYASRPLGGR